MVQWKIGSGNIYSTSVYADISGFSWPVGFNPKVLSIPVIRNKRSFPIPFTHHITDIDIGLQSVGFTVEGTLYSETDFKAIAAQCMNNPLSATGEVSVYQQKLYMDGTTFVVVKNAVFQETRSADDPLGRGYVATFNLQKPFKFSDTESNWNNTGTTPVAVASVDNSGNAHAYPRFEIENTGSNAITQVAITTDGTCSNTLTWAGTLAAGKTLKIFQEYIGDSTSGSVEIRAEIDAAVSGSVSGGRLHIDESTTDDTYTLVLTGSNGASCTVYVRPRDWIYG